jgi:hypothetical protein
LTGKDWRTKEGRPPSSGAIRLFPNRLRHSLSLSPVTLENVNRFRFGDGGTFIVHNYEQGHVWRSQTKRESDANQSDNENQTYRVSHCLRENHRESASHMCGENQFFAASQVCGENHNILRAKGKVRTISER